MRLLLALWIITLGCSPRLSKVVDQVTLNPDRTITDVGDVVQLDRLDNIYVVNYENKLRKYNAEGDLLFEYVNNRLGSITSIDVSNPLQIRVFYQSFGILQVLDNTLSEINRISLVEGDAQLVITHLCVANDDLIWIFDQASQKLIKVKSDLDAVYQSNRMSDLSDSRVVPISIQERRNLLLLQTTKTDFWLFDNFGQFIKKIALVDSTGDWFMFDGESIFYPQKDNGGYRIAGQKLKGISLKQTEEIFIGKPKSVTFNKQIKVVSYEDGIDISKI